MVRFLSRIKTHIKAIGSGSVILILFSLAMWAHIADQFERSIDYIVNDLTSKGFLKHGFIKVNKFSLIAEVDKPELKMISQGVSLGYQTSKKLYIEYSFLQKRVHMWANGNTQFHVGIPQKKWFFDLNAEKTGIKNKINFYFIMKNYFSHIGEPTDRGESQSFLHYLSGIRLLLRNIDLTLSNQSQTFFDQIKFQAKRFDYIINVIPIKDPSLIKFEDRLDYKKFSYTSQNGVLGSLLAFIPKNESSLSSTGEITIKYVESDQRSRHLLIENFPFWSLIQKLGASIECKSQGFSITNGLMQNYQNDIHFNTLEKTITWSETRLYQNESNEWKESYLPLFNMIFNFVPNGSLKKLSKEDMHDIIALPEFEGDFKIKTDIALKSFETKQDIRFNLGYETKTHGVTLHAQTGYLFSEHETKNLSDWIQKLQPIKGSIDIRQSGRFMDLIEKMAQRLQEKIKEPMFGPWIKPARLFADHWIARQSIIKEGMVSHLPFLIDFTKDKTQFGLEKPVDDLIVKYLPFLIMKPNACKHGHACSHHAKPR